MIENSILLEEIIRTALTEDLGAGDLTHSPRAVDISLELKSIE